MSDVSIGTISSEVRLNLSNLQNDVSETKAALASLAASLVGAVETFSAKMQQDAEAAVAAEERRAAAAVERAAASAQASQQKVIAAANQVGGQLQMMGLMAVGALGMAVKTGADFETTLTNVANNTTMTTADIATMTDAVKSLGRESGADLTQLAEGFMHASNFGFTLAESMHIVDAAMKSAVSTGGNVGKTTELLAAVMHEFHIKTADAGKAMDVLHLAAARGNMTLEQFVEAGGPTLSMAANLGISLTTVAAAMSALTRNGYSAAESATQVKNVMAHIAEPSSKAVKVMEELDKVLGTHLTESFKISALHGEGMSKVLDNIKATAAKAGVDVSDLMMKLIQAMRGGMGAMSLAGNASKDFKDGLLDLNAAMEGKIHPTLTAYERQQQTLTAQTNKARNELTLMSADIEKALMPAVRGMIGGVSSAAKWFQDLSPTAKNATVQMAAFAAGAALVTGTVIKTITALAELKASLAVLGGSGAVAGGLATAARVANPVTLTAAMMTMTTDTGVSTLQPKQHVDVEQMKKQLAAAKVELSQWQNMSPDRRLEYVENMRGTNLLGQPNTGRDEYDAELKAGVDSFQKALNNAQRPAGSGTPGKKGGASGNIDVNKWMKDNDPDGGGGAGGKAAEKAADDAKQAIQEVQDKLFALGHGDYAVGLRQAFRDLNDEIAQGVPKLLAYALYAKQIADLKAKKENDDITAGIRSRVGAAKAEQDAAANDRKAIAVQDAAENDDITSGIRRVVAGYKQEQDELKGVADAAKAAADAQEEMFRSQIEGIILAANTQRDELEQTERYRRENPDIFLPVNLQKDGADAQAEERKRTQEYQKQNPDIGKGPKTKTNFEDTLHTMAQSAQEILGNTLANIFEGNSKHWFADMLKSFEQMLAQMVAKAAAAGIINMITGGAGGFLGGFLGGFDDAGNDRWAVHQGFDFASKFTEGMRQHDNSRMAAAGGGSSYGGDTHIHINMGGVQMHSQMDVQRVGDTLARHIQNSLRVRPGTGVVRA